MTPLGVLVTALLITACAAQLIYPDNDAHTFLTLLPASSPSLLFQSYFYSISGIAINASGFLYLADSVRDTIYLATLNATNRVPSPVPFLVAENPIGLAFDDFANLLFWIEYNETETSIYSFNCTSNGPAVRIGEVASTVGQLSLDTNKSVVYLSASAAAQGAPFYAIPYSNGTSQQVLPGLTNSSAMMYSQLWVDMSTPGSFYYVQRNVGTGVSSIMHYIEGGQPVAVLSINSSAALSATFDTSQDTLIYSDAMHLYRCSIIEACTSPIFIGVLPQPQLPLLYTAAGSGSYAVAIGGFLYLLPRAPTNASASYQPVVAPLSVEAMDIDPIHDLIYWLSPYGTVEYLNLTSLAWGILTAFTSDVELLDIATNARTTQTYVSTSSGLYRLEVGKAPELITLQKYRRSIEFISVDAYFGELYFYDRDQAQIHRCQLGQSSSTCDAVTLLASVSTVDSMEFGAGALYWSANGTLRSLEINADAVVTVATAHLAIAPLGLAMSTAVENTLAWLDGSRTGYAQLMLCSLSNCQPQTKASVTVSTTAPRLAAAANGSFCVLTSNTGNVSCASPPSYSFRSVTGLRGYTVTDIAYDAVHYALIASSPSPPSILTLRLSGSNNTVTRCLLPGDVIVGPARVLPSGDILYANQASSTIEVCTGGCQGCANASVLFSLPDTTAITAIAINDTSVYVSLASGNVFAFTAGQVQLLRDAVAPIAGLTVAGSLVWSHTVQGCILSASADAESTAPYATVYAGANSADGLQVFMSNGTPIAAWRYPPSEPTTVQLLALDKNAPIQVGALTAKPLEDFVYFAHLDAPYYRTVQVNETYAWMIIAGLALLAVFVLSIQFVYRTVVRAEQEQEEEELHRQQVIDEDEKERHRATGDSDEQPLLQEA